MGHHPLFQASALVCTPGRARIDTVHSTGPGRVPQAIEAAPHLAQRQAERDPPNPTQPFAGLTTSRDHTELLQPTWVDYVWLVGCFALGGGVLYFGGRLITFLAERALEGF